MRQKIVESLFQLGLIVNPEDADNPGLLNAAIEKEYLTTVEDLLKYGADVNMLEGSRFGESLAPLHSAVKCNQMEMAELLINYGANVNVKGSEGTTPLVYAIADRNTEMTELLLINGADIEENPDLLGTAVMNGSLKIVEDFLKFGADVNMLFNSRYGERLTPLHSAVKSNQVKMVKLLISYGANINVKDGMGKSPIVDAIQNRARKMTKLLLTNGAEHPNNLLHTAVENGNLKIVEDLLKCGADANIIYYSVFGERFTPLQCAVRRNEVEMAKLLINYGADVNGNVEIGYIVFNTCPIYYAIKHSNTEMAELLLINGADVKHTPYILDYAVESGNLKIVEGLLRHGVDINRSDPYGTTALHYTVLCHWEEERRLKPSKVEHFLHPYCTNDMAELLLSKGANVNAASKRGITTLCAASQKGYGDIVKILLKYGAECDPRDEKVIKPLHAAAIGGHPKIIENLLKFGAEVDSRDIYGRTALHFASREGHIEIVKTLLEYGSDVNIISTRNHTPLEYAKFFEDVDSDDDSEGVEDDDYHYNLDNDENLSYTYDSPTTKLLKQHITKMKAAGLHVSDRNLLWISNDREINNFLNDCEAELDIMKIKKIHNNYVSFYDILTKNTSQLAKKRSIVLALKSDDYKTKFPIYASTIYNRFRRGVEREELLEQVRDKFLKSLPILPLLCTEKIFSYLSDKDIRILLLDCKP